jgi:hypothetical protein
MGEQTSLARNVKGKDSLRTTVPMSIVKNWNLQSGDKIDWLWEVHKGKMVVRVTKVG